MIFCVPVGTANSSALFVSLNHFITGISSSCTTGANPGVLQQKLTPPHSFALSTGFPTHCPRTEELCLHHRDLSLSHSNFSQRQPISLLLHQYWPVPLQCCHICKTILMLPLSACILLFFSLFAVLGSLLLSLSLSHSLSLTLSLPLSPTLSHTLPLSHSLPLSLTLLLPHSLSHSLSLFLALFLTFFTLFQRQAKRSGHVVSHWRGNAIPCRCLLARSAVGQF